MGPGGYGLKAKIKLSFILYAFYQILSDLFHYKKIYRATVYRADIMLLVKTEM